MGNTVGFNLRLTPREREAVRIIAKLELRTDTAVIRRAIRDVAKQHGIEIPAIEDSSQEEAVA